MLKQSLCILLVIFSGEIVLAQTTPGEEEPLFNHDPFFSDSFNEWLQSTATEDSTVHHTARGRKGREFVLRLNRRGVDYENVFEAGPYNSNALYSLYPNLPMIHFNRVNALFLGVRKERMQWHPHDRVLGIPNIQLHGHLGYATGQREWQYSLGLEKLIGTQRQVLLGGEYHRATATNDDWRVGLNETSLTAITAGYDYLDYYKQQGWGMYLLTRTDRLFEGGISYNNARFSPLNRATSWSLFGSRSTYRPNPSVTINPAATNPLAVNEVPVDLALLSFSASFNPKQLVLSRTFSFSGSLRAEFADQDLGRSDYDYAKYTAELITHVNFEPGGVLKYRLRASTINGQAPLFKQEYAGGIGTLRALPFKSLSGNQMLVSNAEVQFGSPLHHEDGWVDVDDFYISLFLDSGWVDYEQRLVDSKNAAAGLNNFSFTDLRHNGGLGVGSSLIRAEVAWDFNDPERAPVLWLRFNPTF